MTRTEWDWLLGKPSDETMLVIDDGVLAMLDEHVKKKCAEAFRRGADAMKQAAIRAVACPAESCPCSGNVAVSKIYAIPVPEDTP